MVVPMEVDDEGAAVATPSASTSAVVEWHGWRWGPAPLSQLAARAACRGKCLAAVDPLDFEEGEPSRRHHARNAYLQLKAKSDQLKSSFFNQIGRPETPSSSSAAHLGAPTRYSKLDGILARGKPNNPDLEELFGRTLERLKELRTWLPEREGPQVKKSLKCALLRDDDVMEEGLSDPVMVVTHADQCRREIDSVIASMPEYENSPLTAFLLTIMVGSTRAQLAKWTKKKKFAGNPSFPTNVSGFFEKILPKFSEKIFPKFSNGLVKELRLVNVEFTKDKPFQELLIFFFDQLILLECGLLSPQHLVYVVQCEDILEHLKIEGLSSPLPLENVAYIFFKKSYKKLSEDAKKGNVKFPLHKLQSIHFVNAVDSCQNMILTYMAQGSSILKSVKSNHLPICLKPNYPLSNIVFGVEELLIKGPKFKDFVKKYTLCEVFPRLKHIHLMNVNFKTTCMKNLETNSNLRGLTFYCSSASDFGNELIENIYDFFVEGSLELENLCFKVCQSMCYNVVWSLLARTCKLRSLTIEHSARSSSTMHELLSDVQLPFLKHLCYRKTLDAYITLDTGKFLANLLQAASHLTHLQLGFTVIDYHHLQYHIACLKLELKMLEELTVHASEDSEVLVLDIVWFLDTFPSIRKLNVQVGNENVLYKLRRRLRHTHVSVYAEPETPISWT